MPDRISVSAADFVRSIGIWQERALNQPVSITHHGRERLILLAADAFNRADEGADDGELASLLRNMSEGYIAVDGEGKITAVNRATEAYCGRTERSLQGQPLDVAFPLLNGSTLVTRVERAMKTREAATFQTESVLFPGRHFEVRVFPLPNGVGIVLNNITERETLRGSLAEADGLRSATDQHPDVARLSCDTRGRIVAADKNFFRWLGIQADALLQSKFADIAAPSSRRALADALETALTGNVVLETRILARDHAERELKLSMSPISALAGPTGVSVLATKVCKHPN